MAFRVTIRFRECSQGLNPQQFQQCFLNWIRAINKMASGEVIAIDGKSLRHSYDKEAGVNAIHMVSAWEMRKSIGSKGKLK